MPTPKPNAAALLKDTWGEFQRKNVQWLAAALAFFTTFAVAPLIIIMVEIAGVVLGGHQRALDEIFRYLRQDAGNGAGAIQSIVQATFSQRRQGAVAQIVGWAVFVIGALGLFNALQFVLNQIWEAKPAYGGIKEAVFQRVLAFLAILGVALLLLVSIALNAGLTVMSAALIHVAPFMPTLLKVADFAISFLVLWLAFSFIYEFLPETKIQWSDVRVGGAITSFLFVVGQFLLGWYLGRTAVSSGYGAFGSLIVFLVWVYYSAQIVLFGATLTFVYAQKHGSHRDRAILGELHTSSVGTARIT